MSEREKKAEFFRELTLDAHNRVTESNNAIDSKIQNTLTLAIALIPVVLGAFYYVPKGGAWISSPFSTVGFIIVGAGVICFAFAVIAGTWSYQPVAFNILSPTNFIDRHKNEKLIEIKEVAAATLADIVEHNREIVNRKATQYQRMIRFFALAAVAFSIGFTLLLATALN